MADEPPSDSHVEYGVRYVIDGEEHTNQLPSLSLLSAHKEVVAQIRHHERHKVSATGYRVVRRTVTVTPWTEMADG
jgi:hypothetical protein